MAEATATEVAVEQQPQPEVESPSSAKTTGGDLPIALDEKTGEWVNATPPRDDKGRFAKVRASLENAQQKANYVRGVLDGVLAPDEHTMDPDTWRAARDAQIAKGTTKITPPDFSEQKAGEPEAGKATTPELSPEEIKHFQAHDAFISSVGAKLAVDPDTRTALDGFRTAVEHGAPENAVAFLGHVISDTANPHDVFLALGKNPAAIEMYSHLSPQSMGQVVQELSRQIAAQKAGAQVAAKSPKPAPPSPVGARATASAFDVHDERLSPEEWAKQRNRQIRERGRE